MTKIIGSTQSSFIEGRGLLDSIIVTNEVVEDCGRKKKKVVVVKVDYKKAYDFNKVIIFILYDVEAWIY